MPDLSATSQSNLFSNPAKESIARPSTSVKEQFLQLKLAPKVPALLSLQQMTEVLTISPGRIIPIPEMPAWVMGVYNWRGQILWMVDLGHLCGFTPWYQQASSVLVHKAVVLRIHPEGSPNYVKNQMLGLVVDQVEDVEWLDPAGIQTLVPTMTQPQFEKLVRGYWPKSNSELLAILDGAAIFTAISES